ncbi:PH domain-containing protein [Microbacterium marinilacus]|uniref:Low molecular weight protein antigen 6 PH domain-containing protein n=1 Tax=Microbacterium marinilacus TaxID=415209 RepID=A0ABP7B6K2_9MICO|nr:PH domain-containing protein [Microbacterium marinilacus]MBY0687490.1 PH domain-containing protein [Microbacterium marinilacus]
MTDRSRILRAPTGLVWLVGVAAVVLFLLGDVVVRGSWAQALLIAPWMLIPVWFAAVMFYLPHVAATESGVRVQNVLRVVELPWSAVDEVSMRWQLEFRLTAEAAATGVGGGKGLVSAWAVSRRRTAPTAARRRAAADESDATLEVLRDLHRAATEERGAAPTRSWYLLPLWSAAAIVVLCAASFLASR